MTGRQPDDRTSRQIAADYRASHDRLWQGRPASPADPVEPADPSPAPVIGLRHARVVLQVVGEHFAVAPVELLAPDRHRRLIVPRFVAIQLMRELACATPSAIARVFHRDHTTVRHALDRMGRMLEHDGNLAAAVATVRAKVIEHIRQRRRRLTAHQSERT